MKLSTMQAWLDYLGSVHQQPIALGLERVRAVALRLDLLTTSAVVIVVAGTNGKGSTVAALASVYQQAKYQVGTFTSPYLFKHNEEVAINGRLATDEDFCLAFEAIEAARGEVTLTPFEFHTLAALFIFKKMSLDVMILEVGMGGRLDAVNIMDADVAVITSIDLDHTAWLGETREAIAVEKAGILRAGRPAVIAEPSPPASLRAAVEQVGAKAVWLEPTLSTPPAGNLYPRNLATAALVIDCLQSRLPVGEASLVLGLKKAELPGRQQIIRGEVTHVLDVAHNPHAVSLLVERLKAVACRGKTLAVFSMLGDKDIATCIQRVAATVDVWLVAPLAVPRAASREVLLNAFEKAQISTVQLCEDINKAYEKARKMAKPEDRIIIFGSFAVVSAVMGTVRP